MKIRFHIKEKVEMDLAIERLLEKSPELRKKRRGLPGTGSRKDNLPFFSDLKIIDDAFVYSNSLYALEDSIDKKLTLFNAGAGSPLRIRPFPPAAESLKNIANCEELSQYQLAAGNEEYRKIIAKYLSNQGFIYQNNAVSANNIIFNDSTTEGFNLIVDIIARPFDVVLFSGPTYGLFCYIPERHNAITKIVPLSEEDDWKVNPCVLEQYIDQLQEELHKVQMDFALEYTPRIAAYVNINPSNPTGRIMGSDDKERLISLKKLSKKYGFFIVDDIIYRDLSFPSKQLALPLATIEGPNDNIITMMGASKAYGLAGARAGMIIADEIVIRGIRNLVFQLMDSTPLYVGAILSSIFNTSEVRDKCYQVYFSTLNQAYYEKWLLVKGMVCGGNSLEASEQRVLNTILSGYSNDKKEEILSPIPGIKFAGNIEPDSGFFALLDFTELKGLQYKNLVINTERDILLFFYLYAYTKLLMGASIGWPHKNEFIARVSFAMEDSALIHMFSQIRNAVKLLK